MTTPQYTLHVLSDRISRLTNLFEDDEYGHNIFDSIKQIDLQMQDMMASMQRQENLMNVIIKLLSKNEAS